VRFVFAMMLLLIISLAALCSAQTKALSFKSTNDVFRYRRLNIDGFSLGGFFNGIWYHSQQVDVDKKI